MLFDLIKLLLVNLTPYPPLHEMERGNKGMNRMVHTKGGEVKRAYGFTHNDLSESVRRKANKVV